MKLGILGPKGTFSESASLLYQEINNLDFEYTYYSTINQTFNAIGNACEIGIIPVENTLDGYVQRSLDSLLDLDLEIVDEIAIPIQFSLISNAKTLTEIKKIYVQFKAHGQCLKFINNLIDVEIITTQSNTESYNLFLEDSDNCCAIIPHHMYNKSEYFGIENVTDADSNFTRFFVLKKKSNQLKLVENKNIKVSLFVIPNNDKAGILYKILEKFYNSEINLNSIMSRPTKVNLGTYNFYIELTDSYNKKDIIFNTLSELKKEYNLKILGIYSI